MNLDLVIGQVRQYCAPLQGRVGGAADFDTGTEHIVAFTDAKGALVYPTAVVIPLDDKARRAASDVAKTVGDALEAGFLPAAPVHRACEWCDYRPVCGPY